MNNYEKFVKATGDKIRATSLIKILKDGTEEWRAVVDTGEFEVYEKNINGLIELIRPLRKSNKCYKIYLKDGEIINITSFKPVFKEFKKKNKKDNYAPRNPRRREYSKSKNIPRAK